MYFYFDSGELHGELATLQRKTDTDLYTWRAPAQEISIILEIATVQAPETRQT